MAEILTFSQQLYSLMLKRGLTPQHLSKAIGYSRSEIRQFLAKESTEAKRMQVFERLEQSGIFSPSEIEQLQHALEISRIGADRFRFQTAIVNILSGGEAATPSPLIDENGVTLSQRLTAFADADELEILCLNCCFPGVIHALLPLFQSHERPVRMQHLIDLKFNASHTATLISTLLPLLFDRRYRPLGLVDASKDRMNPISGNLLTIRGKHGQDTIETLLIVLDSGHYCELPPVQESHIFEFASKLLRTLHPTVIELKEEDTGTDFTSLCMSFLSHELNRATYSITYGPAFHQIPREIAIAAVSGNAYFSRDQLTELLSRTAQIHEQRFQNLYHKRKPSYMIMTQCGCEEFLRTGLTLDHFVGFRPFTPQERMQIFCTMLDIAADNPMFTPLLLKDNSIHYQFNIECYDKLGVLLDAKDTNYDLANGYHPVFLMYPDFTQQFQSYYLETLVKEKCHSREKSLHILQTIYADFLNDFSLETE